MVSGGLNNNNNSLFMYISSSTEGSPWRCFLMPSGRMMLVNFTSSSRRALGTHKPFPLQFLSKIWILEKNILNLNYETDSLKRKCWEHDARTSSKALLYQHKSFKKILEICLAGDEIKIMAGYKRSMGTYKPFPLQFLSKILI